MSGVEFEDNHWYLFLISPARKVSSYSLFHTHTAHRHTIYICAQGAGGKAAVGRYVIESESTDYVFTSYNDDDGGDIDNSNSNSTVDTSGSGGGGDVTVTTYDTPFVDTRAYRICKWSDYDVGCLSDGSVH